MKTIVEMANFDRRNVSEIMKERFGFDRFNSEEQRESVEAVLNSEKDVVVSMATNSGKSLCFWLASK